MNDKDTPTSSDFDDLLVGVDDGKIQELDELISTLHAAEKNRTLEEQVAYMKTRGIDPATSYQEWDDED